MSTKFLSPGWRMPRNANQSKQANYSLHQPDQADFIESTYDINGLTQITVSCWIKTTTNNNDEHVWSFPKAGTGSGLALTTGVNAGIPATSLGFKCNNYAMPSVVTVQDTSFDYKDGNWHNVIISSSDTKFNMYIDGVLKASTSITGAAMSGTVGKFFIGGFGSTAHPQYNVLNMSFSDVCIFDYALSDGGVSVGETATGQIANLYGDSINGPGNPMALPNPPIAYYPLGTSAWNGDYLAENNAIGDYVFDFPIAEQSVNISNNFENYTEMSLSTWVNFNNFSGYQYVFSTAAPNNGAGTQFTIAANPSSGVIYSYDGANLNSTGVSVALNTWNHILVTQTGTTRKVFINGQQAGSDITTSALNLNQGTAFIGKYHTAGYSANAKISNVQIFNTALSATDVATLYNYGSPIQTLANIPQSSNLKAWYKLDASEIYNSSSTEWSVDNNQNPSAYQSSLNFDGINDYVNLGNDSSLVPSSLTISLWFKTSGSASAIPRLLNKSYGGSPYDSYFIRINNGVLNFKIGVSSASVQIAGATNVVDGRWHHVVGTYDGSQLKLYLDGNSEATPVSETRAIIENTSYNLTLGCELGAYGFSWPFTGDISNVAIYNTALSASNVTTLYNNGNPQAAIYGSPVSWWKLNNTTTGIEDSKGSNNGTNNGTTTYPGFVNALAGDSSEMSQANLVQSSLQTVAPYSKYSLSFDGTNDYIDCGNDSSLKLTSNFSISVWMKSSNQQSFAVAVGNNGVFSLQMSATLNKFRFNVYSSGWQEAYYSLNPIDDDKWHHVVATHDGSTIKVYVDNVKGTDASAGAIPSNTAPFLIGYLPGNAGLYFDGQISNVSYWNTALTQTQVTETYNEGLPGNLNSHSAYSNLVSWWQLGSNSSWNGNRWIVADGKGTNNGYSQNMAPYMPESGLTNGVGTTANGVSDSMGVGALVGNAPYSTANAISSGMAVQAFDSENPPNVISGRSEDVPS